MKSWHLTILLLLLIICLAWLRWGSTIQMRELLIKECRGDGQCIKAIKQLPSGQLELIKRESYRANHDPAYNDMMTFGRGGYVKPDQHIFVPRTHDSKHQ